MTKLGSLTIGRKNEITIMGILNISPESFYKKSIKSTKSQIIKHVKQLEENGARSEEHTSELQVTGESRMPSSA